MGRTYGRDWGAALSRQASAGSFLGEAKLGQWCSKCGPHLAASISPGNLLEMHVLGVHLESETLRGPAVCFSKPSG